MTEVERLTIERLRGLAERHRRKATIHDALGEHQKATACRTLADLQEDRARRLERRVNAA